MTAGAASAVRLQLVKAGHVREEVSPPQVVAVHVADTLRIELLGRRVDGRVVLAVLPVPELDRAQVIAKVASMDGNTLRLRPLLVGRLANTGSGGCFGQFSFLPV